MMLRGLRTNLTTIHRDSAHAATLAPGVMHAARNAATHGAQAAETFHSQMTLVGDRTYRALAMAERDWHRTNQVIQWTVIAVAAVIILDTVLSWGS